MIRIRPRNRETVRTVARALSAVAAGAPEYGQQINGVLTAIGYALLSQVQQDFARKARGETGLDGVQWEPLKPETVARRRASRSDERNVRQSIANFRRTLYTETLARLTAAENTRAQGAITRKREAELRREATAFASQWAEAEAARIRKDVLTNRQHEILRDTSAMFRSYTPGIQDAGPTYQIFRVEGSSVTVGSAEKPWHQDGNENLPARPSWPQDGTIPEKWWPPIILASQRAFRAAFAVSIPRSV